MTQDLNQNQANGPRKVVVATCLVVSLAIHLAAAVMVMLVSTQRHSGTGVAYIDMDSIVGPGPPAAAEIRQSMKRPEGGERTPPDALPENVSDSPAAEKAAPAKPPAAEVLATSLGRGMASGYFSSFAEGKTLREDIREYYFVLLEKINVQWWLKAETLKDSAVRDGVVEFVIGRDGTLYELRLSGSTGSREVDQAIMEVLKDMAPFPPLPAGYALDLFRAPLKITAPLRLFGVRSSRLPGGAL